MRTIAIVKYVFTFAGAGMLLGALFLYQSTRSFLAQATTTIGTVVDLEQSRSSDSTTYRPVVSFTSQKGEAIRFTSSSGSNPPSYSKGEKVEVFYLPAEPYKAKINGFFSLWGGAVIIGGMGGVFFLIGAGITLVIMLKNRSDEYLKKQGIPIETQFQGVEVNKALSVNGRNPFRITTQWLNPETSEVHVFESGNLWFDPTDHVKNKKIRVFIERNNPKKYYVDVSFLPKLAK